SVTWHADIRPIIESSCTGCHAPGGIAPLSLTTYEEVSALSAAVSVAISSRAMPPWGADSTLQSYQDDPSLTDAEIQTVLDWIDAGTPEGDPETSVAGTPVAQVALPRVDLTLSMDVAFSPDFPDGSDHYRCFPLSWPEDVTRYVTGLDVRPGSDTLVHHVIAFLATPDTVETFTALDEADPGEGYDCYGGPGGSGAPQWLGGWVPGKSASVFPEGTGIGIEPGSGVVLQVHYAQTGVPDDDARTELDLIIESEVDWPGTIQPITDVAWVYGGEMVIPAATEAVIHSLSLPLDVDLRMYSGGLHMHTLATSGRLWVEHEDGSTQWLASVPSWDFSWQQSYWLTEPVDFSAGDSINLECQWDNPGDEDVTWGEGTGDEMCLGLIYMTQR
ncbi:MAG: hypothetical protein ACI8RZ_006814, partial [Myxococcota bacterium]